jgi:hypothetical protein
MLEKRRAVNTIEVLLSPCLQQYDKCHHAAQELVEYGVRNRGTPRCMCVRAFDDYPFGCRGYIAAL